MKLWIYKHYKGNEYRVVWIARHSETLEDLVVYQGLYNSEEFGNNSLRVRSFEEFNAIVTFEGQQIERFSFIRES